MLDPDCYGSDGKVDGAGTMIFGGEEMTVSGYASHGAGSVPSDPFFVDVTDGTIQITCW